VNEPRHPHADRVGDVARVERLGVGGDEELEWASAFEGGVAMAGGEGEEEEEKEEANRSCLTPLAPRPAEQGGGNVRVDRYAVHAAGVRSCLFTRHASS
jgi:hypothetical protein